MLDGYHIITLTHKTAPLETIGNAMVLNHQPDDESKRLNELKETFGWEELLYTSTCNRVIYLFYDAAPIKENIVLEVLRSLRLDLPEEVLAQTASCAQLLHGVEAVKHLYMVASSMDSLVVGEREILRQLRESYTTCRAWGLTGDHLRLLQDDMVVAAKSVYSATGIGEKQVSVVSLAFTRMMEASLNPAAKVLLVGAGQTIALFSKFLVKQGFHNVTVVNRSYERAKALASNHKWNALALDELPHYTEGFDIMVVCTGAQRAIITSAIYAQIVKGDSKMKTIIDLSVPRNVANDVIENFSINYIEIEGLKEIAKVNLAYRERECNQALEIIEQRIPAFRELWHERQVEKSLSDIPKEIHAAKERAINEIFRSELEQLSPEAQQLMHRMMDYLEKKSIAAPMKATKKIILQARKQKQKVKG